MTALPSTRLEAWRYTDLRPLAAISFGDVPAPAAPALPALNVPRLVFLNGVLNQDLSTDFAYSRKFTAPAEDSTLPLAVINAGHAQSGANLVIPDEVDAGTLLIFSYASGATPFAVHPRHSITLGAGAKLTVIEIAQGENVYWHNSVTDIAVGEGAALAHFRLQDESVDAFHLATIRADIGANAVYEHFTASIGSKLSRTELHTVLRGPNARTHLNEAKLLAGSQLGDFTSIMNHAAPNCASRQTVKAVLADDSRGVFQGRIEVDKIAQKTDGYQMTRALLLSQGAEMDIKPELQIFADDVKCSHGATIGTLDDEQLFYLRSRGIPADEARAMLIRAFLEEALEPVTQEDAKTLFETAIENWWARQ